MKLFQKSNAVPTFWKYDQIELPFELKIDSFDIFTQNCIHRKAQYSTYYIHIFQTSYSSKIL